MSSGSRYWFTTIFTALIASDGGVKAVSAGGEGGGIIGGGGGTTSNIGATSIVGQKLLSQADLKSEVPGGLARRFLEDEDASYLASYSLKYQGCNSISQWSGDDGDGAKVVTKRLARMRLCPSGYCSDSSDEGCSDGYGEYVVDLGTYVDAWMQWVQQQGGDGNDGGEFDPVDYAQCGDFGDYYIGPYCTEDELVGFGVFTDETCSNPSGVDFYEVSGYSLPYSNGKSLTPSTCVSCQDAGDGDQDNGDVEVNEMCEQIYDISGRCETLMDIDNPNENGCDYIAGLKIEASGSENSAGVSKGLIAFISVFGVLAVLLGVYVVFLKKKLDRNNVDLNDGVGGSSGLL